MGETVYLILSFSAGMALGAFYFLSLWKTLQKVSDAPSPGFMMLKSYLIRTSVVLCGFYLVMDGHWQRAVAALVGFVVMRMILTRRLGKERLVS
jgi:F1F0 ATPase subunit 2